MNRFWESIILPLIEEIKPQHIIEIGSEVGLNTRKILEYCIKNKCKVSVIDPEPKFNVEEWKRNYGDIFLLYRELSLNVLPMINNYDVVLIDGDHNWYTVYNELKIIEKQVVKNRFPLILLHDVAWPYERRDLYYNPDNIPSEYRHPYRKLGMVRGKNYLVEYGGVNAVLNNAIYEGGKKNGVLTAVEDFLSETKYDLNFIKTDIKNGLGIIIDSHWSELITYTKNLINNIE